MPVSVKFRVIIRLFFVSVLLYYERYKCHDAGAFDRLHQSPLMAGASPMPLWRIDLALGVCESAKKIGVFIIYLVHFLLAEVT
jgi:hypothetical protein